MRIDRWLVSFLPMLTPNIPSQHDVSVMKQGAISQDRPIVMSPTSKACHLHTLTPASAALRIGWLQHKGGEVYAWPAATFH